MASILTRLRERARTYSQSSTRSASSALPAAPARGTPPLTSTTNTTTPTTSAPPLDRRILTNPDALLTSYEHEHDSAPAHENHDRHAGRHEDVPYPANLQPGPRRPSLPPLEAALTKPDDSEIDALRRDARRGAGEESPRIEEAGGVEWSTFGRRNSGAGRTPRLNEFFFERSPSQKHEELAKPESLEKQPSSSPSNTMHESLETFGVHTPEQRVAAILAPNEVPFPKSTSTPSKVNDVREEADLDERTFPRRRLRSWARRSGNSSQSLPNTLKLKRSKDRSYPNLLSQFQISPSPKKASSSPARSTRSASRSSKSKSTQTAKRRPSAEWNALQASRNSEGQWPAMVSREMLRLSGAGAVARVGATGGSSEPDRARREPRSDQIQNQIILGAPAGNDEACYRDGSPSHVAPPTVQSSTQLSAGSPQHASCILSESGPDQPHVLFIDSSSAPMAQQEIFQFERAGRANGDESGKGSTARPTRRHRKASASSSTRPLNPPTTQTADPGMLQIPPSFSVTSPTPGTTPYPVTPVGKESDSLQLPPALKTPSDKSKGKRKAEDVDTTPPPDAKKATFAPIEPRTVRISDSSHAPSSFASYQNKRARISAPPTPRESDEGHQYGSWASRGSSRSRASPDKPPRAPSRASTRSAAQHQHQHQAAHERRTSLSGVSIPISALVSPHAPSVARSSRFHMQDPRKPPRARPTGWALRVRDRAGEEEGSPAQAWLFFVGFVVFPLWWLAGVMRTPETRKIGGSDVEKAVVVDDPQVERDAKAWRFRCRVMSVISLFTYIPFIVLVAVFAPR
ncbi:hypothetical protein HWV62_33211 [Athelia sp. TMB]|nr:hypothetical protein HWV62_33211 [Athelia sp. TMB]